MDHHTLEVLEYAKVKELLSQFATSDLGREAVAELAPKTDREVVTRELAEVSEMRDLLSKGIGSQLHGIVNIAPLLVKSSQEGTHLGPRELLAIANTMRCSRSLKKFLEEGGKQSPRLSCLSSGIEPSPLVEERILGALDESGELTDSASPELKRLRGEKRAGQSRVKAILASMIQKKGDSLQEPIITIRDERYVVPVKVEERNRVKGIVHDVSSTGATVFLEPLEVVELNNEIKRLAVEELEEEKRILKELTDLVRKRADSIGKTVQVLRSLDLIHAKARFSAEFDCNPPSLNENGYLSLRKGRHPLLALRKGRRAEVVPLDLQLGEDYTTLLVTGPNSGGKTVALKTVGILTLMAQSGMHIPASADSELGVFQKVYADIGDEQSIEEDLSSFSSHLQLVAEVLRSADSTSLVLLDEIGGSTDPEEGSSLAMAFLDELTERGVRTLATTHYSRLKLFVSSKDGMENGGMEFDRRRNLPTYKLKVGLPGRSNALRMAEKFGIPVVILKRARDFLAPEGLKLDELIQQLEESLRGAEDERNILSKRRRDLDGTLQEYRGKLAELKKGERRERSRAKREARSILEETRAKCENLVREIRESRADSRAIESFRKTIDEELGKLREEPASPRREEGLRVGERVFIETLNLKGTLLSLSNETGKVEIGGVKVEVPLEVLRRDVEETPPSYGVEFAQDREVSPQLDVRGMRVDEARRALEKYLDDARIVGILSFRVIHGGGTGALRKMVAETLRTEKGVKSFRLGEFGEGGGGVTIVEFESCETPDM